MKKNSILALIQALLVFVISGCLCLVFKGDFFYQYLAPIFGVLAGVFRLITASIVDYFLKQNSPKD